MMQKNKTELIKVSKQFILLLEQDDFENANLCLQEINVKCDISLHEMYEELGELAREVHDTFMNMSEEIDIKSIHNEMPNVKERLDYVLEMTEESVNKTLDGLEETIKIGQDLLEESKKLPQAALQTKEIKCFGKHASLQMEKIIAIMNDVVLEQSFQDLTSQVIKRVATLINEVEKALLNILQKANTNYGLLSNTAIYDKEREKEVSQEDQKQKEKKEILQGLGPQSKNNSDVLSNQDDVDDLLSSLGF